jgi:hypothetical protein
MIRIENTETLGWKHAIRGMRNPLESWEKSDSGFYPVQTMPCYDISLEYVVGKNDEDLMRRLAKAGSSHAKYRRMMVVYVDITAPLYWWKEFDTYKVGTVANSCSTMHKIHARDLVLSDFSCEHLTELSLMVLDELLYTINGARERYVKTGYKDEWWQMIQLLPTSFNQKRTVMLNYEVLVGMYRDRKNHKLDEWRDLCKWIESLPLSEIITGKEDAK